MLIGRLGKNLKYTLNGKSKIEFGQAGSNSIIEVNGQLASIETVIREGDKINIKYAVNGKNGEVNLLSLIDEFNSKYFYVNEKVFNNEPVVIINNLVIENILEYDVKDGDNIEIIYPEKIADIKKYIIKSTEDLYYDDEIISDEYIINDGDRFMTSYKTIEVSNSRVEDEGKDIEIKNNEVKEQIKNSIFIKVNGKDIELVNNENLLFQVFNYIDIDLDKVTNLVSLKINGEKANYTDRLKDGDSVDISWD